MKRKPDPQIERHRIRHGPWATGTRAGNNGMFLIPDGPCGNALLVIVSDEMGWEHVSVSPRRVVPDGSISIERTPTWEEMCWVKDLFWGEEEAVIQYHPPKSKYVNCHAYCLHLWRPKGKPMPMPPLSLVGPTVAAVGYGKTQAALLMRKRKGEGNA
jgi:hypothetical protein